MRTWATTVVFLTLLVSIQPVLGQYAIPDENLYGPGILGTLHQSTTTSIQRSFSPVQPANRAYTRGDVESSVQVIDLGERFVEMNGISDDGTRIVGRKLLESELPGGNIVRWAPETGMMNIGATARGSGVPAISADGIRIVGTLENDVKEGFSFSAAVWTPSTFSWTTWTAIEEYDVPPPPDDWVTNALGVSSNGHHMVGTAHDPIVWSPQPFHWTLENGLGWTLLPLLEEAPWVQARAASNDGTIVAGGHSRAPTGAIFGVRWINGEGEWILDNDGEPAGEILSCNSDCSVMTGNAVGLMVEDPVLAYRWTEANGVEYLQPFEGAPHPARYWASETNEDGSVIVGGFVYQVEEDGWLRDVIDGFIWFDNEDGGTMHHLRTFLGYHGIDFFDDWLHLTALAVSSNGRFITGSGDVIEDGDFVMRGWRIALPENESHCLITSSLEFGQVIVGSTATLSAVVTNAGTAACELTDAYISEDVFGIDFQPTTLVPGAQAVFDVSFSPESNESLTAELTFDSPEGNFSAPVSGSGQNPPIAHLFEDEIYFTLKSGEEDSQEVTIRNQALFGSATLIYEIVDISLIDDPQRDDVVTVDPMEGTVPPASQRQLTISVNTSGLEIGSHVYHVTIATNDPASPELILAVIIAVTTSGEDNGEALIFDLHPAYPNPFNGATSISFEIPQSEHVLIEVLDLTGRRVAVLADEPFMGGRHEVRWDAGDLASGTYLYRIQAGPFSKTLRATVVR